MKNQINISWKKKRKKKSGSTENRSEHRQLLKSTRLSRAFGREELSLSPGSFHRQKKTAKTAEFYRNTPIDFFPSSSYPSPSPSTHTHTHKHKHNVRCCHISQIFIRIEASSARSLKPHLGRLRAFTGRRIQFHRTRAMTNPRRFLHFPPPDPVSTMNKSCIERDSGNSEENHHYKTFPNLKSPKYKYINNNYYNNDNNACPSWLQAIRVG